MSNRRAELGRSTPFGIVKSIDGEQTFSLFGMGWDGMGWDGAVETWCAGVVASVIQCDVLSSEGSLLISYEGTA